MRNPFHATAAAILTTCLGLLAAPAAAQRAALIVGNADYQNLGRLKNPVKDAELVAKVLRNIGFDTQLLKNAKRSPLWQAICDFSRSKATANDAVLLYLAGHGVQIRNQSYFLPIEVSANSEDDFEMEGISLSSIVNFVTNTGTASTYVFIFDACREVVIKREGRGVVTYRGLAPMAAPLGAFIAYSTSPGEAALDGKDTSPFALALARSIPVPGHAIEETFWEVRRNVYHATARKQLTWDESSLFHPFHFVSRGPNAAKEVASSPSVSQSESKILNEISSLKKLIEQLIQDRRSLEKRQLEEREGRPPPAEGTQELKAEDRALQEANLRLKRSQIALATIQDRRSKSRDEQLATQPAKGNTRTDGSYDLVPAKGNTRTDVSDNSVKAFQRYALAITPDKFAIPGGTTIHVDKSKLQDLVIPIDAAREVVRVAYLSGQAQLCDLLDEQRANYQAMMRREVAKGKWTDQQLLYIQKLHQITVMIIAGKVTFTEKDGNMTPVQREGKTNPTYECSDAKRQSVRAQIAAHVNAPAPRSAALTKHQRDLLSGFSEHRSP